MENNQVNEGGDVAPSPTALQDLGELARQVANDLVVEGEKEGEVIKKLERPVSLERSTFLSKEKFIELEKSFLLNKRLQNRLAERVNELTRALEQNKSKQELLEQLMAKRSNRSGGDGCFEGNFLSKELKRPLLQTEDPVENKRLVAAANYTFIPYFVDSHGEIPLENFDTQKKNNAPALAKLVHPWSASECELLADAVIAENKRLQLISRDRNSKLRKMFEGTNMYSANFEKHNILHINWDNVAELLPSRTARECAIRWTCYDHPCINKNKWTKEEEIVLLKICKQYNYRNWPLIASDMPSGRTAIQCFKHYLLTKYSQPSRTRWSKEEDAVLLECVKVFGERNWTQISEYLENRKGAQCLHRWFKALHPAIKRGRWSIEEDKALSTGVAQFGEKNWIKISPFVTGRTDSQCRERWMNVLRPNLNISEWSPHDDALLCNLVNQFGIGKWSLISDKMKTRTDNQVWRRWKTLVNIGAVSTGIIVDRSYLVGDTSNDQGGRHYDTEVSDEDRYLPRKKPNTNKKSNKKKFLQPDYLSKARRPIGGGLTGRNENIQTSWSHIDQRIASDFDTADPTPPSISTIELYDSVLRASHYDPALTEPLEPSDDTDWRRLRDVFQSLFTWPHIAGSFQFSPFNSYVPSHSSSHSGQPEDIPSTNDPSMDPVSYPDSINHLNPSINGSQDPRSQPSGNSVDYSATPHIPGSSGLHRIIPSTAPRKRGRPRKNPN